MVASDEHFPRLKLNEDTPLSRRCEPVRVMLARANAQTNPPRPQDSPLRSPFTILRYVFEPFWLTRKIRRSQHSWTAVAKTTQEDRTL